MSASRAGPASCVLRRKQSLRPPALSVAGKPALPTFGAWLLEPCRLSRLPSICARSSVVETIKIVTETLEALFDMRLAIPAGVVRCLTEGVDLALQK